jgi:hypothetical protein
LTSRSGRRHLAPFLQAAFADFDGVNLEPIDGCGKFVDVNDNGIREQRESVSHALSMKGRARTNGF